MATEDSDGKMDIRARPYQRDAHLRSADFLDVENFPQITFKGDQVEMSGEHHSVVTGELTIRGVTRPVSLTVSYRGSQSEPHAKPRSEYLTLSLPPGVEPCLTATIRPMSPTRSGLGTSRE